ncbi:MAG: VOC family protein [Planctomycetota bacterium]
MAEIGSIHHVALWARDYDAAVAFYREGLGLTPIYEFAIAEVGRAMILRCGAAPSCGHIEIFERPKQAETPAEARLLHVALATDDVDAMHARALAAGATEKAAPKDVDLDNTLAAADRPADERAARFRPRISFVVAPNGEVVEFFDDPLAR